MKPPRLILADGQRLLTDAIKQLLEPEFEVVANCVDDQELLELVTELVPDLVVLDAGLPKLNGLIAGERIKLIHPEVKLLYLTKNLDLDLIGEAFRLGASGHVLKSSAASELIFAIREVLGGKKYVSPEVTRGAKDLFVYRGERREASSRLTLRQREVLQLLANGRTMKEVAFVLDVTPRTVAFHKYRMMQHLCIRSTAELIQFAIKSSLVLT